MPEGDELRVVRAVQPRDLAEVRLAGLDKPFEELTVSELVQLRPGQDVADTYEVNAVTDNVSVTTSAMLAELGLIQRDRAMTQVRNQARLNAIRVELAPQLEVGGIGARSAEPGSGEVRLSPAEDDVFKADGGRDPFQA